MFQKLVFIFLLAGNIGAITAILNVKIFYYNSPKLFEFFRGGQIGGKIMGITFLLGFLGILLFIGYLFKKSFCYISHRKLLKTMLPVS